MDYLIKCSCGHTIEQHDFYDGCTRCTCPRHRGAALEDLIEATRAESMSAGPSNVALRLGPKSA